MRHALRDALEPLRQPFQGVLFTDVMKLVTPKPEARFAILRGEHGYTTNLPLADLNDAQNDFCPQARR